MSNTITSNGRRLGGVLVAARVLGRSERSIRNYVAKGYFPVYRAKGIKGVLIDVDEAKAALDALPSNRIIANFGSMGANADIRDLDVAEDPRTGPPADLEPQRVGGVSVSTLGPLSDAACESAGALLRIARRKTCEVCGVVYPATWTVFYCYQVPPHPRGARSTRPRRRTPRVRGRAGSTSGGDRRR